MLRSDEIRKDVAGLSHTIEAPAAPGEGLYRPELTAATYAELLERARTALELGQSVILDASWSSGRLRQAALDLARAASTDPLELCCVAPAATAEQRIRSRRLAGGDPSDATTAVAAAMAAHFDVWPAARIIQTGGPLDVSVAQAREAIA